ncbi:Peptidyl-prolyl cis-trans isomerase, PpiC-type [Rhodotorula toruloides NP11]|uniref:Peptidyl-prolyl cis-trans isomerase n=1 Tax=Rhodotorula toruloides (strain NP11) TaxID=1130832 RepID=M7WRV6_RHOT1|nr:Peptidyl-prolyl cis-trans isomerase, PpiC-type [Rhodotorula toruloides NP11]EMS20625.1 Peptidyl-prolyl cis-trans isomerase, PpiC-type [Rhodotorula toruloides NP11]KAJ8296908.1 Peptidyl-prolyl cis-trans isomerase pin1 [Rhodotorula toruloides]
MASEDQSWGASPSSLSTCSHRQIRFSNSRKRPYFYNTATQESRWEVPDSLASSDLSSLPGAEHLKQSQSSSTSAGASASSDNGGKIRASHLLVKHSGSRRPASWRQANITRSKDEALEILKGHEKTLREADDLKATFAKLASTESDCSSARDGGDLGFFGRNQMQKPFEDAAFALDVGQLSDIVSTDSGVHVILRTA